MNRDDSILKIPSLKSDASRFALGGALLLVLAGVFLWRDLNLAPELILAAVAFLVTVASVAEWPTPVVGPVALLATALGGGLWFAASHDGRILSGLGIATLGALINASLSYTKARDSGQSTLASAIWHALAVSVLVSSWVFYFRFLTIGIAEELLARRLILTLAWLTAGVAQVVIGKRQDASPIHSAGYLFVSLAVAKALCYDTTHLGGSLRVAVLAGAGALLLGGSWLLSRRAAAA